MNKDTPVDTKYTVKTTHGNISFTGRLREDLMEIKPGFVIFEYKVPNRPNQLLHFMPDKLVWVEGGDAPKVMEVR